MLSVAGFAAITLSVFYYDETTPFPSLYALLPVSGTCAIILFARQGTIVGSLLSLKALVGIGLISYSAYLWHQPLFAFARIRSLSEPTWQLMLVLAAFSLVLAYFSWRYIEVPARKRGAWPLPKRKAVFAVSTTFALLFMAENRPIYSKLHRLEQQVRVLDLADVFCDADNCYAIRDNTAMYFDDSHMSVAVAKRVGLDIVEALSNSE